MHIFLPAKGEWPVANIREVYASLMIPFNRSVHTPENSTLWLQDGERLVVIAATGRSRILTYGKPQEVVDAYIENEKQPE